MGEWGRYRIIGIGEHVGIEVIHDGIGKRVVEVGEGGADCVTAIVEVKLVGGEMGEGTEGGGGRSKREGVVWDGHSVGMRGERGRGEGIGSRFKLEGVLSGVDG